MMHTHIRVPGAALLGLALLAATALAQAPATDLADVDQVLAPVQLRMAPLPGDQQFFQEKFGKPDLTNDIPASTTEDDLNQAVRTWPLLPPDKSADQAYFEAEKQKVKDFIKEHRTARISTGYHPALAWDRDGNASNGIQPLIAADLDAGRTAMIERPGLRVAEPNFLADNQITEAQDSDGNWIYKFGKTDSGSWYRFDDVKFTFYIQKKASLPDKNVNNRYPDIDGTRITDKATFGNSQFLDKYEKLETADGKFRLTDPEMASIKYGPPGEVAFDPGHQAFDSADARFEKEKMQMYVVSAAKIMKAPGGGTIAASAFTQAGTFEKIGERKIYVEDHYPPMPQTAAELAQALKAATAGDPLAPSNADIDLKMFENAQQANSSALVRRGFPDPSKGEGLLSAFNAENDNPNDVNSTSTLNFEIGRSIKHRFRYSSTGAKLGPGVDISALDRHIIYIPPYAGKDASGANVVVGPYVGTVDAANPNPEDPYATPEWMDKYTPIAFEGNLLAAVNHLYENSSEKIQSEYGKTDGGTGALGYPYSAKILYKMGAECVIGITAKGSNLAVPPGAMAIPTGFASYAQADFKASADADLTQPDLSGKQTAANGGPNNGWEARDSFFKVNAADCCGNEKVIASGTFSTADNLKPNVELEIEDAQVAPGKDEKTRYVAAIPNDTSGGAAPVAAYSYESPHSRIDGTKPAEQRGYGDFSNQAHDWNSEAPAGLNNPADAQGRSFLDITAGGTKPPVVQNHRMMMNICADDNLGEVEKGGKIVYPISHLSFKVLRPDGGEDGGQTLINDTNNASPSPDPPCRQVEYVFHAEGTYRVVVTARDTSGNERVMTVAVPVKGETPLYQQINQERERGAQ